MEQNDLETAQQLTSQIRALAVRDDYRELLKLDALPDTTRLLDLLDTDLAAAARVHLDAAQRWKARQAEANHRRLEEAHAALNSFDLALTRALLSRIEEDWLTPEDAGVRDEILLRMEARSMETEELNTLAVEALNEHRPARKWWKRRR